MDSKLIPEAKDTNLVFESGIQRRSSEPEIDLELTKRVAINSSVRELRIKEDSLSLLKVFQGRGNSDSPMGGVAQATTNTINISNGSLWRRARRRRPARYASSLDHRRARSSPWCSAGHVDSRTPRHGK